MRLSLIHSLKLTDYFYIIIIIIIITQIQGIIITVIGKDSTVMSSMLLDLYQKMGLGPVQSAKAEAHLADSN